MNAEEQKKIHFKVEANMLEWNMIQRALQLSPYPEVQAVRQRIIELLMER